MAKDDHQAFAELYHRYYSDAYRYLHLLVKVPELAEDITHEVFLKLWEIRRELYIKSTFKGYLFRICHNKAVDFHRRMANESQLMEQLLRTYIMDQTADNPPLESAKEFEELLKGALESLSPQRRKVFEMSREQDMSYDAIAKALGISINTVKVHVSKTLALLRTFIRDQM